MNSNNTSLVWFEDHTQVNLNHHSSEDWEDFRKTYQTDSRG